MRRLGHLALIPAMFLTFTQQDHKGDMRAVTIDMEGVTIAPIGTIAKSYYPAAKTTIRVYGVDSYHITTPYEDVIKALRTVDLRPPAEANAKAR